MTGINSDASKIIFSIFNVFFIGVFLKNLIVNKLLVGFPGIIFGAIFLIASGASYKVSKDDAKDKPNENGPDIYKGFIIANSIMIIISIILVLVKMKRLHSLNK